MPAVADESRPVPARRRARFITVLRIVAWSALVVATGWMVRGEIEQPVLPDGVVAINELVYRRDGSRAQRLDLYLPSTRPPARGWPAVVALHGGGWRGGNKTTYGRTAAILADHGCVVVAVDYLLSRPGTPSWPGNLEDVRAAVRWVRGNAGRYGMDPDRIAVLGSSAGGHLAALLGTFPENAGPVGRPGQAASVSSRVQAVIDFYGPSDLAALAAISPPAGTSVAMFLGGAATEAPERYAAASPTTHVSADDAPMLLVHGDGDLLVPLEQSQRLDRALADAGVPHQLVIVAGAKHGFGFQVGTRDLVREILAFLDSAWNVKSGISAP